MRLAAIFSFVGLSLLVIGCGSEAGASSGDTAALTTAQSIEDTLKGITNSETARNAKDKLDKLVSDLGSAMAALPASAEKGLEGAAEKAKEVASQASTGLTTTLANIKKEIERIAANPELSKEIQGALDKLRGLIK